jgi:hypothetical protein
MYHHFAGNYDRRDKKGEKGSKLFRFGVFQMLM